MRTSERLTTIIDCVAENFETEIDRVLADSAYTTGKNLTAAEEKQVALIGPIAETSRANNPAERADLTKPVAADQLDQLPINPQTKRFDKAAFVYDEETDCYYCPAGKELSHRMTENSTAKDGSSLQLKVYTCYACEGCELAARCRKNVTRKEESKVDESSVNEGSDPGTPKAIKDQPKSESQSKQRGRKPGPPRGREVQNDQHEDARRRQRERMQAAESQAAYARRQHFGETPFAVIKSMFEIRRFLLRGLEGVQQEWRWASTAFNLKKLMSHLAKLRAAKAAQSPATTS